MTCKHTIFMAFSVQFVSFQFFPAVDVAVAVDSAVHWREIQRTVRFIDACVDGSVRFESNWIESNSIECRFDFTRGLRSAFRRTCTDDAQTFGILNLISENMCWSSCRMQCTRCTRSRPDSKPINTCAYRKHINNNLQLISHFVLCISLMK